MITLLCLIILLNLGLFGLSLQHVRNSGNHFTFTYPWSAAIGAFVWEDVLVFSAFLALISTLTLLVKDIRVGLLLLACFWIVRSSGEVLYQFLQQFHRPTHVPHDLTDLVRPMRRLFGDIDIQKCYILLQIMWQTVQAVSIAAFVLLLINWHTLPRWWR